MTTIDARQWLAGLNETIFPEVPLKAEGSGTFVVHFRRRVLSSVYQPVLSTVDGATVAHSARVRCVFEEQPEAPAGVFALTGPDPLVVQLDRSARTLHALNYYPKARATWRLFLRVQARLVESVGSGHGRVFEGILGRLGVPTKDVVIELPRHANEDPALYARALLSYRSLGYRIASECLDLEDPLLTGRYEVIPDIVAVDPRWLPDRSALDRLVGQIRRRGATALAHRIESLEHAEHAVAAGADLLQGFHLGRPAQRPDAVTLDPELVKRRHGAHEPVA
jgi:EAL domain-containing protein (putative c-di-GMP-specific phosphodiesterase class I)